jgi:apolipoprotein N-acyltransferase
VEPSIPAPLFTLLFAAQLAVLSGVLYFLALPGVNLWPLAFVAQAPFILALRGQQPRRAALLGLAAGFTMSVTGFYWLFRTLEDFGGLSWPLCVLIVVLMHAYQGGRMALTGWFYARASGDPTPTPPQGGARNGGERRAERSRGSAALVFVLAFTTSELVYPLLFPWYFAVTVHNAPVFLQVADLGGPYLAGALLLGPSLAIAELVRARLEGDRPGRRLVAAGLAAPLLAAAYGAVRMAQIERREAASPSVVIGVAQGNQPLVGRPNGIAIHRRLTRGLREQGAELVVWSEGAVSDAYDEPTCADEVERRITSRLGVATIFGAGVVRREPGGRAREFNTAFLAGADGRVIGRYDKQFLLPFGEYLPFGETFPSMYAWSKNSGRLSPGDSLDPLVWEGHPITALICYEDILPGFVNRAVRHGRPELLVNLTIDTWFGRSIEPWEHLALAQLRAIEHRLYLVRSTNSGISAIVDATGRVTRHGGMFEEEAFVGEARFMRGGTVYEAVGDVPFYLGAAAIAAMALVRRRRS